MCDVKRCIYCNSESNLSKSDIIPYGLTGAKVVRKFVCSNHNGHTNDEFESESIKRLDFIRNEMGFKTRGGATISYRCDIDVNGTILKNVSITDKKYFFERQIISHDDNGKQFKAGPYDKLKKINSDAEIIPVKETVLELKFDLKELLCSVEMQRTIAKIAYEWHCYNNNIWEYKENYKSIVTYILDGSGIAPVESVVDAGIYSVYNENSEIGTNSIFEYIDGCGNLYVIFNLWNVISYKIHISATNPPVIKQSQQFELSKFHFDGTKNKSVFFILGESAGKGFDVHSESIGDGFKRLSKFYLQQIKQLMTTQLLSIHIMKNQIDTLNNDIKKFKGELIKIVDYEDRKRVIILITLMLLEEFDYKYDRNFNDNMQRLFGGVEYRMLTEKENNEYILKLKELFENGELIPLLNSSIEKFKNIYEHEKEREESNS